MIVKQWWSGARGGLRRLTDPEVAQALGDLRKAEQAVEDLPAAVETTVPATWCPRGEHDWPSVATRRKFGAPPKGLSCRHCEEAERRLPWSGVTTVERAPTPQYDDPEIRRLEAKHKAKREISEKWAGLRDDLRDIERQMEVRFEATAGNIRTLRDGVSMFVSGESPERERQHYLKKFRKLRDRRDEIYREIDALGDEWRALDNDEDVSDDETISVRIV